MANFSYTEYKENSITVIELPENVLGGEETIEFTSLLNKLSENGSKVFVLDLSNTNLMNSSGLGLLASGLATTKKYNIELVLMSVNSKIEKLLNMTGLNKVFKFYNNIEEVKSLI